MLLSPTDIANSVARGLRSRARADEAEQVVYGFDAHDELELHPVIRKALAEDGFGAWAEQTYPSEEGGPRRSEGRRCDCPSYTSPSPRDATLPRMPSSA